MTVLFWDFEGNTPFTKHEKEQLRLWGNEEGEHQMESARILADILVRHPGVMIVLSVSWLSDSRHFQEVVSQLPLDLKMRVLGSTYDRKIDPYQWVGMTKYEQILSFVERHPHIDWIALDDNDEGWPEDMRNHLVHTDEEFGLNVPSVIEDLESKLSTAIAERSWGT